MRLLIKFSLLKMLSTFMSILTRHRQFQYRGSELTYRVLVLFTKIYKALFVAMNYVVVSTPYGKLLLPKTGYATNRIITLMVDLVEPQWKRYFENIIRKASCMIDVGAAADGYYSLKACNLNPNILVIALEPLTSELYWLLNNISLNKCGNSVKALKIALGSSNSNIRIDHENVKCMTLDTLVQALKLRTVDVIKIDVEGNGYDVIIGGVNTIRALKPVIFFEVHNAKEEKLFKCSVTYLNII